jgi:hypothetical protein
MRISVVEIIEGAHRLTFDPLQITSSSSIPMSLVKLSRNDALLQG